MLKYASAQIMTAHLAPVGASRRELRRFAHRHHFDYEVRPGYLYVRSRAISSRCNDNFDEFPAEELEKAYATFKGKPVFVNHNNEDHKRARGVIIDAALHKDSNRDGSKDWWIEVLQEVDARRFPRLAKEILAGNIARTSMGCDVAFSVCSACNNKATTPAEYCAHIPGSKGMMLYRPTASGQKVGEIIRETCYGLKFFENSLLVEPPADPTAYFLGVDSRGLNALAAKNSQKLAYGEQKAPADVDTLREDSCPVCGDRDTFSGSNCEVCGYVAPPKSFQDPDLEKAKQMDLRKDISEFNDPANPNPGMGPDGQMVDPMDPNSLDADGNPMDPNALDPSMQPGGLPGEVQAEVQPGGTDPMDPTALDENGQIPEEAGEPLDPSMLGPDGQPLQPGGQQMLGPDGMPIGPQALPAGATTNDGQPFSPGPNMPQGPGEPDGPEGPMDPNEDLDEDGQPLNPDAGQGAPGTPMDGVADLMCPACGFTADAAHPTSIDMDTQTLPNIGMAEMGGTQAGDVCPNCGAAQLLSPAEVQGEADVPMPV